MIVGTGIDLTQIARIQHSIERYGSRFLNRVYTPAEQAYCLRKRNSAESFAARFAAKEAGAKALGTGISRGVSWLEIEVVREPGSRPRLKFHGRAASDAEHLAYNAHPDHSHHYDERCLVEGDVMPLDTARREGEQW